MPRRTELRYPTGLYKNNIESLQRERVPTFYREGVELRRDGLESPLGERRTLKGGYLLSTENPESPHIEPRDS